MCSRSTDDRMRVVVYVEKQNGDTDVIRTLFGIHEQVTTRIIVVIYILK